MTMGDGFELSGVVHLVRPLHLRARDLEELQQGVSAAPPSSLFYHVVQGDLRAPAGDDPPLDDFSAWMNGVVQDGEVAERLSYAIQSAGGPPESLRQAVLETIAKLPEAARRARAAPPGGEFQFLTVDSVTTPTGSVAADSDELMDQLASSESSVWFYHFIERPWFDPGEPEPVRWLRARGEERIADWLAEAVRPARPVGAMRRRVLERWRRRTMRRRIAAGTMRTEGERAEAGREAVAGLVRRLHQGDQPS